MNNNLLYCSRYYTDVNEHLSIKFSQQIKALENLGFNVYYIGIHGNNINLYNKGDIINQFKKKNSRVNKSVNSYLEYDSLYKALWESIDLINDLRYVYVRMMFPLPTALAALKKANNRKIKTIMEIPTYPYIGQYKMEKRQLRKKLLMISDFLFQHLSTYVDLYALIGENADSFHGKPAVNISNGIDASRFPQKASKYKDDNSLHLLVLATFSGWHGYDRLFEGLAQYRKNAEQQKVIIHVVGGDGDGTLQGLKQLSDSLNLSDSVIFYGPLYGDALNRVFDVCDVGISSLGLHRRNAYTTAELKNREYFTRGLPIVCSSSDIAVPDEYKYYLKVPSDDSPIDIEKIISFYHECSGIKSSAQEIRNYALENMTWEAQYKKLFGYLNRLEANQNSL